MMSTRTRIPSSLEPYLSLPTEPSLILLTGTLGCSVHWLTARFVGSLLRQQQAGDQEYAVVLVSWIRDELFWTNELRRTAGLDSEKLSPIGPFAFVDCLTGLPAHGSHENVLAALETEITHAIVKLQGWTTTLVLDGPDLLLAINLLQSQHLNNLLLKLRSQVHTTIVTCSGDLPLLAAATPSPEKTITPIETETAAFIVQQAHIARLTMNVRELDTGAARDVSGVLRITRGGDGYAWGEKDNSKKETREMEALYMVQRDGNVKVFERGTLAG